MISKIYPCVYCTEDGHCEKYSDEEVTSWCVQGPCKDEKPSNADRIRAMTDEELAKLFDSWIQDCDCNDVPCRKSCEENNEKSVIGCINYWLDWLKEEAKDEHSD